MAVSLAHMTSYKGDNRPPKGSRKILRKYMTKEDKKEAYSQPQIQNGGIEHQQPVKKDIKAKAEWLALAYLINRIFLIAYATGTVVLHVILFGMTTNWFSKF